MIINLTVVGSCAQGLLYALISLLCQRNGHQGLLMHNIQALFSTMKIVNRSGAPG